MMKGNVVTSRDVRLCKLMISGSWPPRSGPNWNSGKWLKWSNGKGLSNVLCTRANIRCQEHLAVAIHGEIWLVARCKCAEFDTSITYCMSTCTVQMYIAWYTTHTVYGSIFNTYKLEGVLVNVFQEILVYKMNTYSITLS